MNKTLRTILISLLAVFGAGFLSVQSTQAVEPPLVVQFEETPLFNEANFLPDDAVSRWVKVTNNSGQEQRIATEAINKNDPDNFASQLNLTIKEGDTVIFDDTLKEFFGQGETYLSSLANGATTQYDFTIIFNSGSGNDYQGKVLGFDILVGFEGTEGGLPLPLPGGGGSPSPGSGSPSGGGGGLPPGLTITDETDQTITTDSVTITWNTSYFSTSQVIYGAEGESHILDLNDNFGAPPKYGYENTTPEYDISPKVTFHSVTISGLAPGTTYYYRSVSHGSLAISTEHSFTTLGEGQEVITEESTAGGVGGPDEEIIAMTGAETDEKVIDTSIHTVSNVENSEEPAMTQGGDSLNPGIFLASVSDALGKSNLLPILILFLIALIIFLFLYERKKKKKVK